MRSIDWLPCNIQPPHFSPHSQFERHCITNWTRTYSWKGVMQWNTVAPVQGCPIWAPCLQHARHKTLQGYTDRCPHFTHGSRARLTAAYVQELTKCYKQQGGGEATGSKCVLHALSSSAYIKACPKTNIMSNKCYKNGPHQT